jgi:hypothetical protein
MLPLQNCIREAPGSNLGQDHRLSSPIPSWSLHTEIAPCNKSRPLPFTFFLIHYPLLSIHLTLRNLSYLEYTEQIGAAVMLLNCILEVLLD